MKKFAPYFFYLALFTAMLPAAKAQQTTKTNEYAVTWNEPGKDYKSSMPLGNGDLGINLWTEENGDIVFLISKTDAWTENGQLVKLGRVRVKLSPSPFTKDASFKQVLNPITGEVTVTANNSTLRAWVDANAPVIHLELNTEKPTVLTANVELWRNEYRVTKNKGLELEGRGALRELQGLPAGEVTIDPDTVLAANGNRLLWLHHNQRSTYPIVLENQHLEALLTKYPDPLLNRSFGVAMKGKGLVAGGDKMLQSPKPQTTYQLDLYALTEQTDITAWQKDILQLVTKTDAVPLEKARQAHQQWWDKFWNRSWIKVTGDANADKVTQGYAMQRWMCGASGRGAMPIKYNGSIFTVGQEPAPDKIYDPAKGQVDPDFRAWGGNLWFQNQRLLYWPMIAAGDTDLLMPFINMYLKALPLAKDRTKLYFKHDGACFPETIYFWGTPNSSDFGWGNREVMIKNTWIRHYVSGGLELTNMMLDAYAQTQDAKYLKNTLLPLATEITTYYDKHWKRSGGKIRMDPAQAIETRQQAVNPTPDIAGLLCVLPRLLALPENSTTPQQRAMWKQTLTDLPPIAQGKTDADGKVPQLPTDMVSNGTTIILPAETFSKTNNSENPELYAVFPFRLYGVQQPDVELATNTFHARRFKSSTCWGQDGIEAAVLGLADTAKKEVTANFTTYGSEKFKWFWSKGHDYEPDMDNGGAGQIILQNMLLQNRGDKILLFPAWPKGWDVDFKLYAPKNTIVEGVLKDGKLQQLKVTPEARKKDVVNKLE
ncbi:DUF5703 domain-containing protein [Parasediminibacterium sp. JCM 36343]|uniref:DUF5703 domain-containing protein n=1 Tax=Parasediminibacterium sp. JCM 36343 TaxID=3374279 RepID=UPI00397CA646